MKPCIKSGDAPGYNVVTVIVVLDSLGYWRICKPVIALRPISRISRLTTSASTGRRMKMSVKDMSQAPHGSSIVTGDIKSVLSQSRWRLWRGIAADRDLRSVLDFDLTRGDDLLARFDTLEDSHLPADPRPGFDRSAHRLEDRLAIGVLAVLANHIDAIAVERVIDGGLRQHHDIGLQRQHHCGIDEHAGQQGVIGIWHRRLNGHRPGISADLRLDRRNLRTEIAA